MTTITHNLPVYADAFDNFTDSFTRSEGFDPTRTYCLMTGAPIGTTDESESFFAVSNLPSDQLIDDLSVRLLASMRPSIHWNLMREESFDVMRQSQPVQTFAYLLNRLLAPEGFASIPMEQRLNLQRDRIQTFQRLRKLHESEPDAFTKCLHMLIEADSKFAFDKVACPFNLEQMLENPVAVIGDFYANQCKKYDEQMKRDKAQARWIKYGNPVVKESARKIEIAKRPVGKARQQRIAKKQDLDFFESLFDEITRKPANTPVTDSLPKAKRAPRPALKLGKLNLAGGK